MSRSTGIFASDLAASGNVSSAARVDRPTGPASSNARVDQFSSLWPPTDDLPAVHPGDRVHLVGIGGAGMSGLARVLAARGLLVSGSDRSDGPVLEALRAEGIHVAPSHAAENVPPGAKLVVVSPAVPHDNPELAVARTMGIAITKRAAIIGALMDADGAVGVAVAGTHGKTTTSGLAAYLLTVAGLDPTYFVGGDLMDLGTNAHAGSGPHLVVEADEYDRTFLAYRPEVAILTNVEHDHPDHYPSLAAMEAAFRIFASQVKPSGRILANAASAGARNVLLDQSIPSTDKVPGSTVTAAVEWYYVDSDPEPPAWLPITWRATDLAARGDGQVFDVRHGADCLGTFEIRLPGRHNVGNALAAIGMAHALGVDPESTRRALATYRGTARRFQVLGHVGGMTVVDDYAHHPTEITATIAAARSRFPGRRLWAIVQPHTYSRVAALAGEFAASLEGADRVLVTPIYAAREVPVPGIDHALIASAVAGPPAEVVADLAAMVERVSREAEPGDVLLCMGAGDISDASYALLEALMARALAALAGQGNDLGLGGTRLPAELIGHHTSLRVGGPAGLMVRVQDPADLEGWFRLAQALHIPTRVLGRGSNVLVEDRGFGGLILLNRCERWWLGTTEGGFAVRTRARTEGVEGGTDSTYGAGTETEPPPSIPDFARSAILPDGHTLVLAESGVSMAALGHALARQGWSGLEAAVGIPGSIGAGVVTNAGAHGWEMADQVMAAEILDADGACSWWSREALALGYRSSALKGRPNRVVLRVLMHVAPDDPEAILRRVEGYTAHRRRTQPATPSVGSMFKNPPGDFAGRLIEAAGLKGQAIGGAQISTTHANFFVNQGGAKAADVEALIGMARQAVLARFGIQLELEIEPVGNAAAASEPARHAVPSGKENTSCG